MRHLITLAVALLTAANVMGQAEPEQFLGINALTKDSAYYADQAAAWGREVKLHPTDEKAWKYYFMAVNYRALYDGDYQAKEEVVKRMGEAIPDSYTYYYTLYRSSYDEEVMDSCGRKAVAMLPKEKDFFDYDVWTAYLVTRQPERAASHCKAYLRSGIYSDYALAHARNVLASMEPNSIYFGSGDLQVIPLWMLQYGKGKYTDRTVVALPMLTNNTYRQRLFHELGIDNSYEAEVPDSTRFSEEAVNNWLCSTVETIRKATGRTVYFPSNNNDWIENYWYGKLFPEGLVQKCSDRDYDWYKVMEHNYEKVYNLSFLKKPASEDRWSTANVIAEIFVSSMKPLLYRPDMASQLFPTSLFYSNSKLFNKRILFLISIINGTNYSDAHKQEYIEWLDTRTKIYPSFDDDDEGNEEE